MHLAVEGAHALRPSNRVSKVHGITLDTSKLHGRWLIRCRHNKWFLVMV